MKPALISAAVASLIFASAGVAQTGSVRDTATAYGARLNAKGQPAALNQNRVNNRINSRIDSRLSLRIERYRPDSANNPTAALAAATDDKSRTAPVVAPPPQQDDERP
jgi:hypothetical protein